MGSVTFLFLCCVTITLPACAFGCKGRVILTESSGVISDGDQEHPNYARCEWLIDAGDDNKVIYLEFDSLNTECSYDFLFIFDGDSYQSPKLASLSGYNSPEPILSKGGKMLIYLFSDRNYKREGFRVRYLIQDCPLNCSGNGHCIDHVCVCDTQFTGRGCETEICPGDCGAHGICDNSDSVRGCKCDPGYSGYLCNISLNDAAGSEYWYTIAPTGSQFEARSAHAGTFLYHTNCLYIFGGFTLNDILNDLKKFCLEENKWENITQMDPWPDGRYEHAIVAYKYGFYMFGGVLDQGYSNELWYYNATAESWRLCAENSTIIPPKLSGHTLSLVEEDLYLFGGKTEDGSFKSDIYKINADEPEDWVTVIPYGGKSAARRLVGHSAVYHRESRSLLIFGGYSHSQDQPRFGTHTEKIHAFNIDNKIWSHLQPGKRDAPSQRSFHSALIMGNYMVVYGGNTHIHHDNELCFDYEIYLYHLGCHSWVRVSNLMGKYAEELRKKQPRGRVSHVAVAAYGNLLLVVGGFSGYVKGDLMAFKFPSYVAPPQTEATLDLDFCSNYTRIDKCGYNPECFYCNNISTTNMEGCMHRTQNHLCRETKTYYPKADCPGICSSLKTCQECLSQGQGASLTEHSPEKWTYIQPCNWCVKNAQCQRRSDPERTCKDGKDTESGIIGWWGGKSASLSQLSQCAAEDFPAGLQAIKYRPAVNIRQPDEVKIIRETTEAENFRHIYTRKSLYDRIKWTGFIHPLNATIKFLFPNSTVIYSFKLMVENVTRVNLSISKDDTIAGLETIVQRQLTQKLKPYEFDRRPSDHISPIFPNISRGCRYYIDIHGMYQYPQHTEQMSLGQTMYRLELEWNGIPATANSLRNYHTFTSEFLEPYSNGNCDIHNNCLSCMTDALCAWCDVDQSCVPRNATAEESMCVQEDSSKMLVTDGGVCPVCDDHVECLSCAQDPLCEWVKDGVVCVRRGRVNITQKVVTLPEECPAACHGRSSCSECLQMRECAWCENLHTCLPFSDYVSRHRHGQCTEWIDSEEATKNPYTCRNCSAKKTCEMCLDTFSCGWCGNTANPTKGVCAEGDFSGPYGNITCEAIVSKVYRSVPINESADWSYSMCPDVEECLLGLARCHKNATCINTPTSYNCTCNRGYVGDGFDSCDKTCYYKCGHGICLEDPPGEFFCDCNLGWTGVDCAQDCLCNGHSMCESGPGQCDYCDNNTTGEHCEQCKAGHFGDPSKPDGCYECRCNGHGDPELGVCHNETGACFCVDNTFGFECPDCLEGYYGDPHDGGKCYLSCDHGMIVENITRGSLGSHQGPGVSTWKAYCLWIMTVAQDLDRARSLTDPPTITVDIEDLAVECERDHVYVYDGTPEFVDSRGDGILLGAFCGFYTRALQSVTAHSGIITIYFHADISGNYSSTRGFNASYYVNDCEDSCSANDNKHCLAGQCVCKLGYTGDDCSNKSCQTGCTYDELTASCECEANFGGFSYQVSSFPWVPTATGTDSPAPVSRYGHTIIHCDDTVMYVFGGRSLEYGLLNDIWLYDFETQTWTEIRPITSDQPAGRYFHAGACVPVRKNLYIFGGLVQSKGGNQEYEASKEMWKFAIDARKWTGPIQPSWVMGLAGHSMTLVEETILVIIGGFSTTKYFSDTVYEFDANIYLAAWQTHKWDNITGAKPTGIYGHSAVYNEVSKTIYIYGGHVYRQERLFISDRLFTYDIINKSWNILQPEKNSKVEPRYFHTAVGFNDYMAIMGGYTQHRNSSDKILIYKFRCNYWYLLDFSGTPMGKVLTSLVAAKSILYENSMVITGGYNNTVHSLVYKVTLPEDLCTLSSDFNTCTLVYGCEARVVHHSNGENVTLCNRNDRPAPESTLGPVVQTNSGTVCNYNWHAQRDCESITECSECIAVYPQFKSIEQSCHWCSKCSIGKCIARHKDCKATGENKCQVTVREPSDQVSQRTKMSCQVPCLAATCDRCSQMGCIWSQHFKRVLYSAGEVKWKQSLSPIFDWSCVLKSLKKNLAGYPVFVVPTDTCPAPCYVHSTCAECLDSWGGEGGSQECYWSETLNECMPPAYLSLRCLAGECGTILQGSAQKCPKPCDVHKKCGDCRKAPGCGWCAFGGLNGLGVCMAGTRSGPMGQCDVNNVSYEDRAMAEEDIEVFMRSKTAPSWAYATCPPEDECSNGHHSCNVDTQNCKDTLEGYICECKEGYIWNEDDAECKPVCHQGCVPNQGVCILPDTCQCYFGFVGKNCSTECECNRHSNCRSVEHKNDCLDCKNNTQGKYCQECKPLFVGNPKDGGKCVSCTEFCNNHTDICLYWAEYNDTYDKIQKLREKFPDTTSPEFHTKIADYLPKGPSEEGKTYCVDCQHHTFRSRCDECKLGYFRLTSMTPSEPCTKCMCNGHSDICDQKGGLNCVCKNKTETKCSAEVKLKMACYEVQCAVCKEYFLGTPTDGHQCYRQMNVNREYCFDPITQNDCTRSPDPLLHGRTVFFAVQPKYVNVDIRVTIDVTQGGMDVYFSPRDNTFTVDVDKITGVHTVRLDSNERFISLEEQLRMQASGHGGSPSARNIRSLASNSTIIRDYNSYVMHEKKANDLNTFITVTNSDTILLIRNVQYRLVITLPCDLLDLRTSRFYIIFLSTGDGLRNETYGSLYFRQDQPHIDLFVFFSVFFSCFFLFLAMCVLLWKTKQAFDARRSRQQRAREMLHMASRPFAKVLVLIEHSSPFNISPNLNLLRSVKNTARTPLLPSETSLPSSPIIVRHSFDIIPIAIEPTDDGVAGVVTVVFQLPGGSQAPTHLCLGSTLTKGYQLSHTSGKHRRLPNSSQC